MCRQIKSKDNVSEWHWKEKEKDGKNYTEINLQNFALKLTIHQTAGILTVSTNSTNRNANYLCCMPSKLYSIRFFFLVIFFSIPSPDLIQFQLSLLLINLINCVYMLPLNKQANKEASFFFILASVRTHTQKKRF